MLRKLIITIIAIAMLIGIMFAVETLANLITIDMIMKVVYASIAVITIYFVKEGF